VTLLFLWILNPNYGLLKVPFQLFNIPSPAGWRIPPDESPAILINGQASDQVDPPTSPAREC